MEIYFCVPPLFPVPQLSPRGNNNSEFYTCHFPAFWKAVSSYIQTPKQYSLVASDLYERVSLCYLVFETCFFPVLSTFKKLVKSKVLWSDWQVIILDGKCPHHCWIRREKYLKNTASLEILSAVCQIKIYPIDE